MTHPHDHHRGKLVVGVDVRCLADPYLRGFSRYTFELITALSRRPDLQVLAFTDASLAHAVPVQVVRFSADSEIVREQFALPRLLRRHAVDVLLCPTNRGLPIAAPCPTVLTLHDAVEWDPVLVSPRHGRARLRFAYASAFSLAGASLIITVSQASAHAIQREVGVDDDRLRVVHEAANARFSARPDPRDEAIVEMLGIGGDYVLYVGGFDKKKDLPTLVRAFARAHADSDMSLVLAGRITDEVAAIARFADELCVGGRLVLPGYVSEHDLPSLYRQAQCFAFPAIAEGFGLPVVEAMACGVPVVAAESASLPEIVGGGGRLFAPSNADALAELLRDLIPEASRTLWSAAALRRAADFSWDATAGRTEVLLREAAAEPARTVVFGRLKRLARPSIWHS